MRQATCDICGQPATIHETAVEGGAASARHFCREHGEPILPTIVAVARVASLQAAEEYYRSLSEADQEQMALLHRLLTRSRD